MQVITQGGGDVVVFSNVQYQPCRRIQNGLQPVDQVTADAAQYTVTEIDSRRNERVHESVQRLTGEGAPDWTYATEMEETRLAQLDDVLLHRQFRVQNHSEITDRRCFDQRGR